MVCQARLYEITYEIYALMNEETQKLNNTKTKKVNEVIRLFEERKITQNTTAQKLIKGLLSPKPAEYQKALTQ